MRGSHLFFIVDILGNVFDYYVTAEAGGVILDGVVATTLSIESVVLPCDPRHRVDREGRELTTAVKG
jgi:hypothetical protein